MSEPAVTAFFKRFAVKFVEVVGAGIATALSGYLLAHFSGYWSSPASMPPVVQVAPNTGTGTTTSVAKSQRSQPAHAASADAKEQRLTTATAPVAQPARAAVGAKDSASSRKQLPAEVPAVETKPHDEESVEAQVRAALANVDAIIPRRPRSHLTRSTCRRCRRPLRLRQSPPRARSLRPPSLRSHPPPKQHPRRSRKLCRIPSRWPRSR